MTWIVGRMKKIALLAAPLALAASLAFAPTASAAPTPPVPPSGTPAIGCIQVVNLDRLPLPFGLDLTQIDQTAAGLGLPSLPNRVGAVCKWTQPNGVDAKAPGYPGSGPVILRPEYGPAVLQEYCTDSRSLDGASATAPGATGPTSGIAIFASGCVTEPNPIAM